MRKSLDSHYVNNLLRRDWRVEPREYLGHVRHSITEKDIIRVERVQNANSPTYKIYCNLVAGANNFYDYILANWGPVWEDNEIRLTIIPTLPSAPIFSISVENPDGDDMLGDYDYALGIEIPEGQGPFIVCGETDSAYFAPNYSITVKGSTYVVNFNGIWIINPGQL